MSLRPPPYGDHRGSDAADAVLARGNVTHHRALSFDHSGCSHHRSLPLPSSSPASSRARRKPGSTSSFRKLLPSNSSKTSSSASTTSSSSSSSFWKTAISYLGRRRLDCAFTLHIHSVDGLPLALDGCPISVQFRRIPASASARPVLAAHGAAAFQDEALTLRSPVYFSRAATVKYEPRAFTVSVFASALDLGKHDVDLTRLLPLSFRDLDDDGGAGFGKWTTSFRLSGPARGARINVTFSCALVGGGEQLNGREPPAPLPAAGVRHGSMVRLVSVEESAPVPDRSRDVRVLHEVFPSLRFANTLPFLADEVPDARTKKKKEVPALDCEEDEGSPEWKHCTSVEVKKGDLLVHPEDDDFDHVEFDIIDHGVEIATADDPQMFKHVAGPSNVPGADAVEMKFEELFPDEELEDLESMFSNLSFVELEEFDSPPVEDKILSWRCTDEPDNYKSAASSRKKGRSRSMDDASSDNVAREFLDMLGIEHSPFEQLADGDPESPRERLWKQFEKEALASGNTVLGLDFSDDSAEELICEDVAEDFDLSAIIREAELELQNASQRMDVRFQAQFVGR